MAYLFLLLHKMSSSASLFERMCVSAKTLVAEGASTDKQEFNADKELLVELVRKERKRAMQECEKPYNTFLNEVKQVSLRSRAEVNRTRVDNALEQLQRALTTQNKRYAQKAAAAKEIQNGEYAPSNGTSFINDDPDESDGDVLYVSSSDDGVSSDSALSQSSGDDDEEDEDYDDGALDLEFSGESSSSSSCSSCLSDEDEDEEEEEEEEEEPVRKRKRAKRQ
jgi:hypothetical protein